jgi:hypothetical protein
MATPNFTAGDVMSAVRALLNDNAGQYYSNTVQIPYINMAMLELREYLELSNSPVTNYSDTVLTIPAGTTVINYVTTPALPQDLVDIRQMWYRPTGDGPFVPLTRKDFLPHWLDGQDLYSFLFWAWYDNAVHIPSSSQINDLKLDYIKQIAEVVDENSQLSLINGQSFLNYRTAALLCRYVKNDVEKAQDMDVNAQTSLDRTIGIESKGRQAITTRRRPFRQGYKNRGRF